MEDEVSSQEEKIRKRLRDGDANGLTAVETVMLDGGQNLIVRWAHVTTVEVRVRE